MNERWMALGISGGKQIFIGIGFKDDLERHCQEMVCVTMGCIDDLRDMEKVVDEWVNTYDLGVTKLDVMCGLLIELGKVKSDEP